MSEVPLYANRPAFAEKRRYFAPQAVFPSKHLHGVYLQARSDTKYCGHNFTGKEFQFKNLLQGSLLHERFTITHKDHAV